MHTPFCPSRRGLFFPPSWTQDTGLLALLLLCNDQNVIFDSRYRVNMPACGRRGASLTLYRPPPRGARSLARSLCAPQDSAATWRRVLRVLRIRILRTRRKTPPAGRVSALGRIGGPEDRRIGKVLFARSLPALAGLRPARMGVVIACRAWALNCSTAPPSRRNAGLVVGCP